MTNWFRRVGRQIILAASIAAFAGCGSFVAYYDVTGVQTQLCTIQGSTTICDEGRSSFTMTLGVEESDGRWLLFWDNASWDAELQDDGKLRAVRYHEVQNASEACHTVQSEILTLEVTEENVEGIWERESQTEGPATCGNTPAGQKDSISLEGIRAESL